MNNPQSLIRSSRWVTRGWTFQEALLSRGGIFAERPQLRGRFFECFSGLHPMVPATQAPGSRHLGDTLCRSWGAPSFPCLLGVGLVARQKLLGKLGEAEASIRLYFVVLGGLGRSGPVQNAAALQNLQVRKSSEGYTIRCWENRRLSTTMFGFCLFYGRMPSVATLGRGAA